VKTPDGVQSGRVQKAPENFLDRDGISTVIAESKAGRRNFIRSAFAAAAAGAAALSGQPPAPAAGDARTQFQRAAFRAGARPAGRGFCPHPARAAGF